MSDPLNVLRHLLKEWEGFPDNVQVQLAEYMGDEVVAEDSSFTPGENAEIVATLGQLRRIVDTGEQAGS